MELSDDRSVHPGNRLDAHRRRCVGDDESVGTPVIAADSTGVSSPLKAADAKAIPIRPRSLNPSRWNGSMTTPFLVGLVRPRKSQRAGDPHLWDRCGESDSRGQPYEQPGSSPGSTYPSPSTRGPRADSTAQHRIPIPRRPLLELHYLVGCRVHPDLSTTISSRSTTTAVCDPL
jgi:hypothetical protein